MVKYRIGTKKYKLTGQESILHTTLFLKQELKRLVDLARMSMPYRGFRRVKLLFFILKVAFLLFTLIFPYSWTRAKT